MSRRRANLHRALVSVVTLVVTAEALNLGQGPARLAGGLAGLAVALHGLVGRAGRVVAGHGVAVGEAGTVAVVVAATAVAVAEGAAGLAGWSRWAQDRSLCQEVGTEGCVGWPVLAICSVSAAGGKEVGQAVQDGALLDEVRQGLGSTLADTLAGEQGGGHIDKGLVLLCVQGL